MYIAKENLFLNANKTKVVKEGDKAAAFLLTTEGAPVSKEDVQQYDLGKYVTQPGQDSPRVTNSKKTPSKKR